MKKIINISQCLEWRDKGNGSSRFNFISFITQIYSRLSRLLCAATPTQDYTALIHTVYSGVYFIFRQEISKHGKDFLGSDEKIFVIQAGGRSGTKNMEIEEDYAITHLHCCCTIVLV